MAEISTQTYAIRHAQESDVPHILNMIKQLASYEKAESSVEATEESLLSTLSFPSNPSSGFAKTLLVFPPSSSSSSEPDPVGMALYFHNYSTWTAAPGIYLEDLFVQSEYRGRGFGKALLQALARECVKMGCKRLDWSVLKWNQPSIDFYVSETVGANMMEEWAMMRVDGGNLVKLAGSKV